MALAIKVELIYITTPYKQILGFITCPLFTLLTTYLFILSALDRFVGSVKFPRLMPPLTAISNNTTETIFPIIIFYIRLIVNLVIVLSIL
jgi:hypothetical protein